jgi:uncharacterized membrane protein YoaK (UPF0700 family)
MNILPVGFMSVEGAWFILIVCAILLFICGVLVGIFMEKTPK